MKKALLFVDVQNDFLPKGALAVNEGDKIVPIINALMPLFKLVIASRDWHPKDHISFAATWNKKVGDHQHIMGRDQILWPVHCVQNTWGSEFPKALHKNHISQEFHKGIESGIDSYSVFLDQQGNPATLIDSYLREHKITDLYIAGLATDYCVKQTVLDALSLGYKVYVVVDGCKAVNLQMNDETMALEEMKKRGAHLIYSKELIEKMGSEKTSH